MNMLNPSVYPQKWAPIQYSFSETPHVRPSSQTSKRLGQRAFRLKGLQLAHTSDHSAKDLLWTVRPEPSQL